MPVSSPARERRGGRGGAPGGGFFRAPGGGGGSWGRAGNLGGGDENAEITVALQAAGEAKPMRTGFVTTAQFGARMRGRQFGEEFKHVVMRAANDPATPDQTAGRASGHRT